MLKSKNKVVAITMGDPEGIGPEVIIKALKDPHLYPKAHYLIIGSLDLFKKKLFKHPRLSFVDIPYKKAAQGALSSLNAGIAAIKEGIADSLVTAPLSKERVAKYSKGFKGHTEYLADAFGIKHVDMMFATKEVKLVIATRHEPVKNLPILITKQNILSSLLLLNDSLKNQFGIKKPKIAVLGFNPHAGEGGLLGREEIDAIIPAMKAARQKRCDVSGPYAADTFFIQFARHLTCHSEAKGRRISNYKYDAILAMYHDQGLIPMKTLYFQTVVNTTIGLPFIRTSPVHGTGFDIANQNKADHIPMLSAINLAASLS